MKPAADGAPAAAQRGPLSDLAVVEMGQLIAGPFCGQLLGDMGAEVIKIEPPGAGDPLRAWGDPPGLAFEVMARNKLSVSLNLRLPAGQELARRLIAGADVLVENFKPGTLEGWGLAPETLRLENPRLIVARMSGYGQSGPYRERAGFGGIGEAMGGWRRIVGDPDRPPARMGVSIGDTLTGTFGAMGVLAALHHRTLTGDGQTVDAALYESVLQVMEGLVSEYSAAGVVKQRSGAILPGIAPSNVYPCSDGEFMIGANNDSIFRRLTAAMGAAQLADDPRYATHAARGRHQGELDEIIAAWTATLTVAELEARMIDASVPAGRLYTAADMLADPHFTAREAIVAIESARWPGLKMQGVFPKLSATPGSVRRAAPRIAGQDNEDVFGGRLGLTREDLARLTCDGVI